ncbi:hypothetical protein COL26b_010153 [Colletotrichum chrysophilum]|uniref:uncharacterized protein n=1 Tax=Colletotrichum chrysophilum TaxID=1836956 RepID=UPI002300520F|nr:uncharacterized protein COL26b_010153 [Colletotrichum chrysophilum]KAJ0370143.1 hypothetical protein COL26b_010153 [Colletotrichum chrysophilum]
MACSSSCLTCVTRSCQGGCWKLGDDLPAGLSPGNAVRDEPLRKNVRKNFSSVELFYCLWAVVSCSRLVVEFVAGVDELYLQTGFGEEEGQ